MKEESLIEGGPSHGKIVVCYFNVAATHRPDKGKFTIEDINPNLCTHLIHATAGPERFISLGRRHSIY